MKNKGDNTYSAEDLLHYITSQPKTTNQIREESGIKFQYTLERLLKELMLKYPKIQMIESGNKNKIKIWWCEK
jgi:hypothetical protein